MDSSQNLGGHHTGLEGSCSARADLPFEIQRTEWLKNITGQKSRQQKALDGIGVMPMDVVGMPSVAQFVEPMIPDIQALVAEGAGAPGGNVLFGNRGDPHPVAGQRLVFAVELAGHRQVSSATGGVVC